MTDCTERTRQNLLLLAWFSPAFPVGGFAFSHGLEWAQETGAVTSRATLETWLADVLSNGSGRTDAILLAATWRAATQADIPALTDILDLAAALQPSAERFLEASVQGTAFLQVVKAAYPSPALETITAPPLALARLTLPVAAGLCGAAHGIALEALIVAYLAGFVANLSSAAVRLGIVGQTDGQRIIAALHPGLAATAEAASRATLDDLGSATLRADLFSLQHETQYSRLFRS